MSPSLKRVLLALGGTVGLLVLLGPAVPLANLDRLKPRLEAAASEALGMEVRFGGRLSAGFFPRFHIAVQDGRVLDGQGTVVASARKILLGIELFPLLRKELRLRRVELTSPKLSIIRDLDGRFNVERLKRAAALLGTMDGASLLLAGGTILYSDRKTGEGFEASRLDLLVSRVKIAGGRSGRAPKDLAGRGDHLRRDPREGPHRFRPRGLRCRG